ncbi:ATP-binding cassette domain-containing protein [Brevundimonas diminuta]|uniref:amino acid ABC transporter ATP-binding/permease protein n=1 Tax=Brevundimonas diminuta TaxID=293 RepID=UPI002096E5B9|nr:ATP-binding cassette domain-containing protein [Brevundimonas diminuta]MCO8017418.1 ATP-binding cassette domain-containing protein [Brevundimonas diminuta]MCO8020938.1 ATP-binding cassette domain-containing protein [Brevundimonas diminuta]
MSRSDSPGVVRLKALIRAQEKAQRPRLLAASVTAALVSAGAVLLLGLSGWFITAAALAGAAGPAVAHVFNYMVPSAMIRFFAIVRTASRYGERVTGHDAALKALAALRPQLFIGLARAPTTKALSLAGGEASARLVQDVDAIQDRFVRLSTPCGAGAGLIAGVGMAALAGWAPALVVASAAALGVLLAVVIGRRVAEPAGQRLQQASGALKTEFAALAAAAPELQAYGMKAWAADRLAEHGDAVEDAAERLARAGGLIMASQSLAMAMGVAGAALAAGAGSPALTALSMLAAVATVESAGTLLNALRQNGAVKAAVQRLGELLDEEAPASPIAAVSPSLRLSGADLTVAPPQRLAIIGPSGAGKTTLIERMMGLRPASPGEILHGDAAALGAETLRPLFAYASQQAVLLTASVRDNLRLAAPSASDDDLWAALEDAALADRIRAAPGGLDASVGENGARLSGGERRRLGLARAYLRPAPWLVLDEPTEGLDAATEAQVLERLCARLHHSRQGLIVVSHRPAPLDLCDVALTVSAIGADGRIQISARPRQAAA